MTPEDTITYICTPKTKQNDTLFNKNVHLHIIIYKRNETRNTNTSNSRSTSTSFCKSTSKKEYRNI